jgi:hypothetical protein
MGKFKNLVLTELGNTTDGYDWSTTRPGSEFKFKTRKYTYIVQVNRIRPKALQISFQVSWEDIDGGKNPFSMTTNEGDPFRIVATVIDIAKFVWRHKDRFYRDAELLEYMTFEPSAKNRKEGGRQRRKLYLAFVQKQFPNAEIKEGINNNIRIYLEK